MGGVKGYFVGEDFDAGSDTISSTRIQEARMDGSEIAKHIPEIVSVAKVAAGSIPFTGIVKRMLGPAADEVAEMWRDKVKLYRYERQLKCVEKAEKMAREAGFTPQAVPPKILFPLLEGASMEDDESLHDLWASLLANASSPKNAEKVRPGFIAVLRQLAKDEALLLNWLFLQNEPMYVEARPTFDYRQLKSTYQTLGCYRYVESYCDSSLDACLEGLEAAQFIRVQTRLPIPHYVLTMRGYEFVRACAPPTPKS